MASRSPASQRDEPQRSIDDYHWHGGATVVELPRSGSKKLHAPDTDSDSPRPACYQAEKPSEREWTAKRLTGGLAAFRAPCQCEACYDRLLGLADELGVEFDA